MANLSQRQHFAPCARSRLVRGRPTDGFVRRRPRRMHLSRSCGVLMSLRYLFGPALPRFVEENLLSECQAGACIPFDHTVNETWEAGCASLPGGWRPDVLFVP